MDRSLARGYANRFLDKLTPHRAVLDWHGSPRRSRALTKFSDSSLSKKPGRVLERLRPLVNPPFDALSIAAWNCKKLVVVGAQVITIARESTVLHPDGDGRTLFDERAAFLNHAVFRAEGDGADVYGSTAAGIGAHAIVRLIERDLATPKTLPDAVVRLLGRANTFRVGLERGGLDPERPWSLIFPIPGGVACAVTHRVRPWPDMEKGRAHVVASVRTVLRAEMLSPDQMDRMAGAEEAFDEATFDPDRFEAWVRRSARPWVPPAPTATDQNGLEMTGS